MTAEIAQAMDGAQALVYLFGQGAHLGRDVRRQPSFVLLDMNLPKLSGLDVLRAVRKNPLTALIPVVMLTSSNEPADIAASYHSGANGFVCKPVDFVVFTEKLRLTHSYWLGVNLTAA